MVNGKFVSLGRILWRVLNNPLAAELTFEEAAEYTLEFIRLLGAPLTYIDKIEEVELCDYKAELPCDLYQLRGIKYSNDNFNTCQNFILRGASDIFHLDTNNRNDYYNERHGENTYTIQKGIIFTSKDKGKLKVSYKAVACDEDGYPMIPDDEKVFMGLQYYILFRYLEPLWLMGKITDKAFSYITQEKCWYVAAAQASMQNLHPDRLETMMNSVNRILINTFAHEQGYKNVGNKERFKRYS